MPSSTLFRMNNTLISRDNQNGKTRDTPEEIEHNADVTICKRYPDITDSATINLGPSFHLDHHVPLDLQLVVTG